MVCLLLHQEDVHHYCLVFKICIIPRHLSHLSLSQSSTSMAIISGAILWWFSHLRRGFHSSVADGSFAFLVTLKSHFWGDCTVSCPPLVVWFLGFATCHPPSSGLLDSERSSYHIGLGCLSFIAHTRYAMLA